MEHVWIIFEDEDELISLHLHAGRWTVGVGGRGLARADLPGVAGGGHLLLLRAHPLLLAHPLLGSWCRMEEGDCCCEVESCSPLPAVERPPQSKYYSAIYAAMMSADLQMS